MIIKIIAAMTVFITSMLIQTASADLPCVVSNTTCLDGPSTKNINGLDVTRACWQYEYTYKCGGVAALSPNCSTLLSQGCYQVGSACTVRASDGICDIYTQNYICPDTSSTTNSILCGGTVFCEGGNCADTTYKNNTGFVQSYGGLAAMEEAAKDLDQSTLKIFSGIPMQCKSTLLSLYDCCDMNGILNGLLSCSAPEEQLAKERQLLHTVEIGTFCSNETWLGVCLENTTTFCDFKSMLARIIQVQGRSQLGLNFGSPQSPDCSGLTLDQFASLDFNAIDFSEFTNQFAVPSGNTSGATTSIQNKINAGSN